MAPAAAAAPGCCYTCRRRRCFNSASFSSRGPPPLLRPRLRLRLRLRPALLLALQQLLLLVIVRTCVGAQTPPAPPAAPAAPASTPPNIVYILADDLGWNDVGYMNRRNEDVLQTPHLDRLASEGVVLDNYYVQSTCTPSRSVLLTGKLQIHTGMQHSIVQSGHPHALGVEHPTIAEELKRAGYATHMVGKWHLGYYQQRFQPLARGFDSFFGFLNGAEYYYSHVGRCEFPGWECQGPNACWGVDFFNQTEPVFSDEYSTDLLTRRAEEVILGHDAERDGPLFLYLPYQAVHGRLEAPPEAIARFAHVEDEDRRVFAAMLHKLDEGIGNVTRALERAGLANNTVLVFSSDNGGDPHFGGNNYPLRGWKGSYWEGGIRAVGFVHSPLLQERGVVRRDLVSIADWFPTLLRLAGVAPERWAGVDGVDQWDTISASHPSPRTELLHNIDPMGLEADPLTGTQQAALRSGPWKLLVSNPSQNVGQNGWVPPPTWKDEKRRQQSKEQQRLGPDCAPCTFTRQNLTTGVCLFNVEEDPEERCNLAAARPDLVVQLLERLEAYNRTSVPARYPPPDPRCDPARSENVFVAWGEEG